MPRERIKNGASSRRPSEPQQHAANVVAFPPQALCELVHARVATAMLGEANPVQHTQGANRKDHD